MKFFRGLGQIFVLVALALTLFDLVREWVGFARFKIRTVEEVWKSLSEEGAEKAFKIFQTILSYDIAKIIFSTYAPLVLVILALVFYLVSRLLFLIDGKGRAARL